MYRYFIQPQLNKANQSLIGYELLMKQHTSRGWQPPVSFSALPAPVIADTLRQTAQKLVLKIGSVSVNLNRMQMLNHQIQTALIDVQNELRPVRLVVELTEEPEEAPIAWAQLEPMIQRFVERGIEISLDDVATGENKLSHIRPLLPYASEMKFALQNDAKLTLSDARMPQRVRFWRDLAAEYHMRFILEGIESAADDRLVDALGIDLRQGYFYGKPQLLKLQASDPTN